MSASQRRKGRAGEIELAKLLSEQLGWVVKRNIGQSRDGGDDITTGQFRWECKRRAKLSVYEFMEQVEAACESGDIPVVAMRADSKGWLVMLRLEDALPMIRGELPER